MDFYKDSETTGHCVARHGSSKTEPNPPARARNPESIFKEEWSQPQIILPQPTQHVRKWVAVAAGLSNGILGLLPRGGYGISNRHSTRADAEKQAIALCRKTHVSCKVVMAFNKGCGYATIGRSSNGAIGWGAGPTAEEAYRQCTNQGVQCETPKGNCVD
jgi:hypothetical protein